MANIVRLIEYFQFPGTFKQASEVKKLTLAQIIGMENNLLLDQISLMNSFSDEEINLVFSYFKEGYNNQMIMRRLTKKGYDESKATALISEARKLYIGYTSKKKAQNDMIYGGLWFVGGTVGTLANIGFIFYGAIIFGMIQFFKGVSNYKNS